MHDIVFESNRTVGASEFEAFVLEQAARGDSRHCELLNGRIVMNPPAGYPHGEIGSNVQHVLGRVIRERTLGKLFDSSQGFDLPSGDTVEPDHSFVSLARWKAGPPPEEGRFLRVVPNLIVEVLSPKTASQDRGEKKAIYAQNGVEEYWLVDHRARELIVFVLLPDRLLEGGGYDRGTVYGEDAVYLSSQVIPGLTVSVREILP